MKNTKIIFILLLFSIGFIGCTKIGRNITVQGKVLNPLTNEPYKDIEIRLLKSKNSDYYGGYKMIKSTTSDDNGAFELNAGRLRPIWLSTNIEDYKEYYSLGFDYEGKYYSALKVDKGEVMDVDYHMVPYGDYRITINNINCQGIGDTVIIHRQNEVKSFLDKDWILTGCNGYTTSWNKVPMGKISTKYTVIRSGVSDTYEENFEVYPNQQNEQVINY